MRGDEIAFKRAACQWRDIRGRVRQRNSDCLDPLLRRVLNSRLE